MNDQEIMAWIKENAPPSCDSAWQIFRGKVSRDRFRKLWNQYHNKPSRESVEEWVGKQKDITKGIDPRVLFLDIEVSEGVGTFYDAYKGRIRRILQPQILMSVAWQFLGEDSVKVVKLPDYKGYRAGLF